MVNQELLLAISDMMDNKLEPIKTDIRELKEEVRGVKGEVRELKVRVQGLEVRVQRIELVQEHEILPRLQNIEKCYLDTFRRYQTGADQIETIQEDTDVLKKVVAEHSLKLQNIS